MCAERNAAITGGVYADIKVNIQSTEQRYKHRFLSYLKVVFCSSLQLPEAGRRLTAAAPRLLELRDAKSQRYGQENTSSETF